jgi:acyl-CoA thioesterase-1
LSGCVRHPGGPGILAAALIILGCALFSGGAAATEPRPAAFSAARLDCTAPDEITRFKAKLPNTARAIRHGKSLTIVAIGSSSTEGVGATDRDRSYPMQLARALTRQWPNLDVTVINKGVGGEDAQAMLTRFETDVLPYQPQLVVWQVGSNYALRSDDHAAYAAILKKGVNRLKSVRTDIILMDLQYAPMVLNKPAHRRVVDTMRGLANDLSVAVFRRFDIMRYWVSSGKYRMEDVINRDRLHMNDTSYACIGRLLADSVTAAARALLPAAAENAPAPPGAAPAAGATVRAE